MRNSYLILIMVMFALAFSASGQQVFTIKGVISKKISTERVGQVVVSNLRSGDIMMSDELGWFSIKTAVGDTLLFTRTDYTDQKIVVVNTSDMPVYMQPVIKLETVTIQGQTKKQELQDVMNDYNRKGVYYNGKPPLASLILNPLNDLHLLFGKDAADLRRFKAYSKDEIEYTEVHKRYNLTLVKQITGTTDSAAKKFMAYYTPSYNDIKVWNDYDLIDHIKSSYGYYEQNKTWMKLNDLNPALVNPQK